jgi:anti-sigma28 factor (negative regulator of flagellin synthesis)
MARIGSKNKVRVEGFFMRVSTINTNIMRVETPEEQQSEQTEMQETSAGNPLWRKRLSASATSVKQLVAKRGTQVSRRYSRGRAARIEALRAQVEAGTYHVDSLALAERILVDETHFMDEV